jgi:hypothetical protein
MRDFRQDAVMDEEEVARQLLDAIDKYSPYYDEVFWEVHTRITKRRAAGKLDLAALICWKRSGQGYWVADLMNLPDIEIRERSHKAFAHQLTDQQRLDALASLPGFKSKSSIATAVLACIDPYEFGVLDWRALKGLERIERPIRRGRGETLRYLECIRELRDLTRSLRPRITARNIDQGLWHIGGE